MTMQIESSQHIKDPSRPWLPGPPPLRRHKTVEEIILQHRESGKPSLETPVQVISATDAAIATSALDRPFLDADVDSSRASYEHKYLFHGCGSGVTPEVLSSFSEMGPSIRFARKQGYFSRTPSVYWTNSLKFAIAWCIFTKTGRWAVDPVTELSRLDCPDCLVYVSIIDPNWISRQSRTYFVPSPKSPQEEANLVEWCFSNMAPDEMGSATRVPPPGSDISDWSFLGSRVPKQTIDGLTTVPQDMHAPFSVSEAKKIWLYAACDENTCQMIAEGGIMVLHISTKTPTRGFNPFSPRMTAPMQSKA